MLTDFKSIALARIDEIGAKAYNIAKISNLIEEIKNVKVAKALVITTEEVSQLFHSGFSYESLELLYGAISKFFNNKPLIVRSSSVNEDSFFFSGAGQYNSFLNIQDKMQFINAIMAINDSSISKNAKLYSKLNDCSQEKSMAILVQKMVSNIDLAGVLYTVDPVTGSDNFVIEASLGSGEKIAAGQGCVNTLYLDKEYSELSQLTVGNFAGKEKLLYKLLNVSKILENHFKRPLDLEWGIKGETLYIFQARPTFVCGAQSTELVKRNVSSDNTILSKGIGIGILGDSILFSNKNILADNIEEIVNSNAILLKEGGVLSHFASISREFSKPTLKVNSSRNFEKKCRYVVNGFNGNVMKWSELNSELKGAYFLESIDHILKNSKANVLNYMGIKEFKCTDKFEQVYFNFSHSKVINHLEGLNYIKDVCMQKSITYDMEDNSLIKNNIICRSQVRENGYIRLQIKKISTKDNLFRAEQEYLIYFNSYDSLTKFIKRYAMISTGQQERELEEYVINKTVVKFITWPKRKSYIGIESEKIFELINVAELLGLSDDQVNSISGKEIFDRLNLNIENCKF